MFAPINTLLALALAGMALGAVDDAASPVGSLDEPPAQSAGAQEERQPIDVNAATAEDLQKVPGIGVALSQRIIEFRQEHGRFETLDDLLNVRGIGTTSLEKLRPFLVVKKQG